MIFDGPGLEETVKGWLVEGSIYHDSVDDESAHFHFLAEYPEGSGNLMDVINPINHPDMLLLVTEVSIDPMHVAALKALPASKRKEFLEDLLRSLIFQPVGFQATPGMEMPEKIQLVRDLYKEDLSKTALMEGLGSVNRCVTYIIWKYKLNFDDDQTNDPPGTMYQ